MVARTGSAGADFVAELERRWIYDGRGSLLAAMATVTKSGPAAREAARREYEEKFRESVWVRRMVDLYEQL